MSIFSEDKKKFRVTFDAIAMVDEKGESPDVFWYFTTGKKAYKFMEKKCNEFTSMTGFMEFDSSNGWAVLYFIEKEHVPVKVEKEGNTTTKTYQAGPVITNGVLGKNKIAPLLGPNHPWWNRSVEPGILDRNSWGERWHIIESTNWIRKGIRLSDSGQMNEALESFNKALEVNENHVMGWYLKGQILGCLGKPKEDIECQERALQLFNDYPSAWLEKGIKLDELGKHQEALACYNKTLELNPNSKEAKRAKSQLETTLGNCDN